MGSAQGDVLLRLMQRQACHSRLAASVRPAAVLLAPRRRHTNAARFNLARIARGAGTGSAAARDHRSSTHLPAGPWWSA
jgi:hypothetical protein